MTGGIRLACGIGEQTLNHHKVDVGPFACIAPIYGVRKKVVNRVSVLPGTKVIQDCGAFSDACITLQEERRSLNLIRTYRLSFKEALKRQEAHAKQFRYEDQIIARASYDVLIDETWSEQIDGTLSRIKKRWSETEAELAVEETVAGAAYLHHHRNGIPCIFSAQGVTPDQYLRCAQKIVPFFRESDTFGFGGWCILGKKPYLLPMFRETIQLVIPFLAREGIKKVHIWGVCWPKALAEFVYLCDQYDIDPQTDSMGPSTRPTNKHREWGYGSQKRKNYQPAPILDSCRGIDLSGKKVSNSPLCTSDIWCMGHSRIAHIREVRAYMAALSTYEPQFYRFVPPHSVPIEQQPGYYQETWL